MATTPSKRRRLGRQAFEPDCDPMDFQPYNKDFWGYDIYLTDWIQGWNEEKERYEAEQEAEKKDFIVCPKCEHEFYL